MGIFKSLLKGFKLPDPNAGDPTRRDNTAIEGELARSFGLTYRGGQWSYKGRSGG